MIAFRKPVYYWFIILALFLGLNLFLVNRMSRMKKEYANTLHQLDQQVSYQLKLAQDVVHAYLFQLRTVDTRMSSSQCFVDTENQTVTLNQLTSGMPYVVFFRFFRENCYSCMENLMVHLVELSRQIGPERIVVVSDFDDEQFGWLSSKYALKFVRFTDPRSGMGLPVEELRCPFFFICKDGNMPIKLFPLVGRLEGHFSLFCDEARKLIVN